MEWSRSNALTRDVNYPTNMTWARVLEVVARLYGISSYAEEAEKVRETVRRQSWNGTFFVDRALRLDADVLAEIASGGDLDGVAARFGSQVLARRIKLAKRV